METKESNYKDILKSNITLFLSYTVLLAFIFLIIIVFIRKYLVGIFSVPLSACLSLMCGIIIYHIFHFVCRSSTIESLKKEKMNEENSNKFLKKMNLFFIICIIGTVIISISYLYLDRFMYIKAIAQAHAQYDFISKDIADSIETYILIEYKDTFYPRLTSTIIIELSAVVSFLSLVTYQKHLLEKFNKY